MVLKKGRHLGPPFRLALLNIIKPYGMDLKPSVITVDVTWVRSTLKGIVNIKVVIFEIQSGGTWQHQPLS
jgi:hypothetical protein